ncbi:MAG: hypothetical protein M9894_14800 [Planctomycetes bacterium]|nr:hypothetical protein [Planctomycetota bacterium]
MLDLQGWLACPGCGAWGGSEALCPGCGAARGPRVPLDQSPGDGGWVLAARGDPDAVLAALDVRSDADRDVLERVGVARRAVEGAGQPVSLWLDLRPAEAGHVARRSRNPGAQDTVFVLPWLLLRRGDEEARLVRTVHQRVRRAFVRGGAETTTTSRLDELVVLGPSGTRRRPVARLDRVGALEWGAGADDAPEPAPLPPTAPGQPGAGGRAPLLLGLLAAALLVGAVPLGLGVLVHGPAGRSGDARARALAARLEAPGPVPERVDEVVALGLDARAAVRLAARSGGDWAQVHALVAGAAVLERAERLRLLAASADRPDARPELRQAALDLLAGEGDLGGTHLARLARARAHEPEARAEALRGLLRQDPARGGRVALDLLDAGVPPALRRACLQALGAPGAVRGRDTRRALAALDRAVADDDDPGCRDRAVWALANVGAGDERALARLLAALGPTLGLSPPTAREARERQALRCRALVRAGLPPAAAEALAAHPGLGAPAARALRGGLQ